MSNVSINIDGKEIVTQEGEFILNAARANDIYIPAICYLTRCSPTLACRICLVEADGKQVYACNAKAKDGMNITTTTENRFNGSCSKVYLCSKDRYHDSKLFFNATLCSCYTRYETTSW